MRLPQLPPIAGRRSKWMTAGVWLLLVAAVAALGLPAKFSAAERNETSSFLPGDAESTRALAAAAKITGGEDASVVIVYRRAGGLTRADEATIAREVAALERLGARFPQIVPGPGGRLFIPAASSADGTTALVTGQIRTDGRNETITEPVAAIREQVRGGDGLQAKVTGAAGYSADALEVFKQVDSSLLLTAAALVLVLLALIYRSPLFLWIPLLAVMAAELLSRGLGWVLTEAGATVNGQSAAILSILVLGAGTDYALLLVARYREELRRHEDRHEAMALALRRAGPAIVASAVTVMLGLLCLSFAQVNGTAGLGPIGAVGILCAMASMLTLLPTLLVIFGRRAFWPRVPRYGEAGADEAHGAWRRVADRVARSQRPVLGIGLALLIVFSLGLLDYSSGLNQTNSFRGTVEAVEGQRLLAKAFPSGATAPTSIVVPAGADAAKVARAVGGVRGVATVRPVAEGPGGVLLQATLEPDPYSAQARELIGAIRGAAQDAGGRQTLVGGPTAVDRDLRAATVQDAKLIVPVVLAVVLIVLIVLLRALAGPLLLVLTVVLSFAAALGFSSVVFDLIFGFPGSDPQMTLYAFVFLVALGIDYNIFLMTRVREEALRVGTREGMLRGLAVTGGVITAAGIVLAGTFAVLAAMPMVFLTEIGFIIAFGVLLDTFVVRSLVVPALVLELGDRVWWPGRARRTR